MDADKVRGMLWGVALGDALGAPHEFARAGYPLATYDGTLRHPLVHVSRWKGKRTGVVGQVTDDTEMTLALAAVVAGGEGAPPGYDADAAALAYMAWGATRPFAAGHNTRALFFGIKTLRGFRRRHEKLAAGVPAERQSQSNGCLMRCAPLAALGPEAGAEAAARDCELSNPHPVCGDACEVYVRTLAELGAGRPVAAALADAAALAGTPEVAAVVRHAADPAAAPRAVGEHAKRGWVLHALWCAFRALARGAAAEGPPSFAREIDWVVRLGGDTDTNAAIAGAALGAHLGFARLAAAEPTRANLATLREGRYGDGELARPAQYGPGAIDGLARALARP
jgi:ADP-ribosylglycohydrolase